MKVKEIEIVPFDDKCYEDPRVLVEHSETQWRLRRGADDMREIRLMQFYETSKNAPNSEIKPTVTWLDFRDEIVKKISCTDAKTRLRYFPKQKKLFNFTGLKSSLTDARNAIQLHSYNVALQSVSFIHYKDILEDIDLVDHIIGVEDEIHAKSRFKEALDSAGYVDAIGHVAKLVKEKIEDVRQAIWAYKIYKLFMLFVFILLIVAFVLIKLKIIHVNFGKKPRPAVLYRKVEDDVELRLARYSNICSNVIVLG